MFAIIFLQYPLEEQTSVEVFHLGGRVEDLFELLEKEISMKIHCLYKGLQSVFLSAAMREDSAAQPTYLVHQSKQNASLAAKPRQPVMLFLCSSAKLLPGSLDTFLFIATLQVRGCVWAEKISLGKKHLKFFISLHVVAY